jgi:hypothetical protein
MEEERKKEGGKRTDLDRGVESVDCEESVGQGYAARGRDTAAASVCSSC